MNLEKILAGIFAGAGALILLYQGHTTAGTAILGTMLGFFVGEANGRKEERATHES